jgi:hypothetical protein
VCSNVTCALMRQRLDGLHSALCDLHHDAHNDEDAWSDASEEGQDQRRLASAANPKAAGPNDMPPGTRRLVETDRERHIRMGLITPFQDVPGVARGITRVPAGPLAPALVPSPLIAPASQGAKLKATARRLARRQKQLEETLPAVKIMEPDELDEDMLQLVQKPEYFMQRKGIDEARYAAETAKPSKHKRAQTLPRSTSSSSTKRRCLRKAGVPVAAAQALAARLATAAGLQRRPGQPRKVPQVLSSSSDDDGARRAVAAGQGGDEGKDGREELELGEPVGSSSDSDGVLQNVDDFDDAGALACLSLH